MGCSHGSRGRTNQRLRTRSLSVPFALSLNPRRLPPTHSVSRVCRASVLAYGGRMLAAVARVVLAAGLALCERAVDAGVRMPTDAMTSRPGRAQTACSLARGPRPACWEARLPATLTGCVDEAAHRAHARARGRRGRTGTQRLVRAGCAARASSPRDGTADRCPDPGVIDISRPTRPAFFSALLLHQPTPSAAFCSSHPPTISHGCPRHCPCTYSPTQISLRSLRPDSSPFSPPAWRPYRRQRPQALRLRKGAPGTPSSVPSPLPSLISLRHSSPSP